MGIGFFLFLVFSGIIFSQEKRGELTPRNLY